MKSKNQSFATSVSFRGVLLLESLTLCTIIAIAIPGALNVFLSHQVAERSSKKRGLASVSATQKLDEIRIFTQIGNTLDEAFGNYGPLLLPISGPGATFNISGLPPFYDLDKTDSPRPNPRAVGTVTIINNEAPNEANFGFDYSNQAANSTCSVEASKLTYHYIANGAGCWGFSVNRNGSALSFSLSRFADSGVNTTHRYQNVSDKTYASAFVIIEITLGVSFLRNPQSVIVLN